MILNPVQWRKWLICILCSVSLRASAQNLILEGKMQSPFAMAKTGKLYYAKQGLPFDTGHYVTYDSLRNYRFEMPVSQLIRDSVDGLVFSLNPKEEWGCTSTVYVGKILAQSDVNKNITVKTDLLVRCAASIGTQVDWAHERFLGNYTLKINDTLYQVKLNQNYGFSLVFPKPDTNFMSEIWGSWEYNDSTNMLIFQGRLTGNRELGLYLGTSRQYQFKVLTSRGKPVFEIENGSLVKE